MNHQIASRLCMVLTTLFPCLLCFVFNTAAAVDTITSSQFIKDPEYIQSPGNVFRLGFFSPVNSTYRYAGIWYSEVPEITPVWVANRNLPLNDSSGILTIFQDGNLVILNGEDWILWSSNVSIGSRNTSARLTDLGNIELVDSSNGSIIWESFQEPCDAFLPNMKLEANSETGERTVLRSWKTDSDPSVGTFSAGVSSLGTPQLFIWNGTRPYWRSQPWNGRVFMRIFQANSVLLTESGNRIYSLSYPVTNQYFMAHFVLTPGGEFRQKYWDAQRGSWGSDWRLQNTACDVYGVCGSFGVCNAESSPICSCLRGYDPNNPDEWNRGIWTNGCVRRSLLQCERAENGSDAGREDRFLKMEMMKVPDFSIWSSFSTEQECHEMCLSNCSCLAYGYEDGIGCLTWGGDLSDLGQYSDKGAALYVRLAYSEFGKDENNKALISIPIIAAAAAFSVSLFFSWRWIATYRDRKNSSRKLLLRREVNMNSTILENDDPNQVKLQELPLFSLEALSAATENFDESNKLGQGGFGPVYRGKLPDGREIAVKRLSRASGQGQAELTNEVVVISKLQHRNLVRLFGCCVEGEEKMLVYEFMPNGSLDAFIFDPLKGALLDWKKRFTIFEGICRGLLYLHRDSRLKIIHRDLKASNILLDQHLNPKISDFGMARIFGGNEEQANTNRVVGTYGYMSPEYAMEGKFSEKSDVYSLGVVLLEVISGRTNSSFYNSDEALSLIGFAWKQWNEGNLEPLIDPAIRDSSVRKDVMRSIHVGMLCVQEFANDRPSVSTVLSILNSEMGDVAVPRQPAFTLGEVAFGTDSSKNTQKTCSVDGSDTITNIQSR